MRPYFISDLPLHGFPGKRSHRHVGALATRLKGEGRRRLTYGFKAWREAKGLDFTYDQISGQPLLKSCYQIDWAGGVNSDSIRIFNPAQLKLAIEHTFPCFFIDSRGQVPFKKGLRRAKHLQMLQRDASESSATGYYGGDSKLSFQHAARQIPWLRWFSSVPWS
ncbi:hypothetical protein DY000_02034729 [Brassica cretica]|uniref:Uncharacterized protein n=1 Tax=Brassica cretica TaxID=69181 RepID=A0ABQ7DXJ0_BRACR|nr:hypothetical protein DY000_02034729 [Brassica cretica]